MTMICKQTAAPSPAGDDPLHYVLSDETEDRLGDVVSSSGWSLSNFKKNPIALFNHDRSSIVGTWRDVTVEDGRLVGRLQLAEEGTSSLVDSVRKLVRQGILRSVSVGFHNFKQEPLRAPARGMRFLKNELIEASLVSIPANPNAVQIARQLGIPARDEALLFGQARSDGQERSVPAVNGKLAKSTPSRGNSMSKLAKRIQDAQAEINRLRDHLVELTDKEDRTDEEAVLFEELPNRIASVKKELGNLEAAEQALATREATVIPAERIEIQRPFTVPRKKLDPRDYLLRLAVVHLLAKAHQQPLERALQVAYGSDEATDMVLRAVVNPALTTVAGWASELVQTAVADLIESLRPVSIYPRLAAMGTTHTFSRNAGAIRVPARSSTPSVSGAWVGEGQPIPVRRIGLTSILLTPKKLAVISTFSREIADYSTPAIEGVLRSEMANDTAVTIDSTLIDANPATAIRPAGLRNGVAGLTPSALTTPAQAMIADIKALVGALTAVNGGANIAILMNPAQASGIAFAQGANGFLFSSVSDAGTRFSVNFITSTTVSAGMVIAVDAADFTSAIGTPEYNVSEQATVHEEDTAPLPLVTGAQGAGVVAATARSLWQTDTLGVRMIWPCDFAMRRTGLVAWMTGVLW